MRRLTPALMNLVARWVARFAPSMRRILQLGWYFVTFRFGEIPFRRIARRMLGIRNVPSWIRGDGRPLALIVDMFYPTPDRDSGSIDAVNLVNALHRIGYRIVFVAFGGDVSRRAAMESNDVVCVDVNEWRDHFFTTLKPYLHLTILSRVHNGGVFMESIRRACPSAKVIFNTVDLHHLREERTARLTNDHKALDLAAKTKARELALVRLADATIVVSYEEHWLLSSLLPDSTVFTVPLARAVARNVNDFDERKNIAFVGGYFHAPNVDGLRHFLDDIWPLVLKRIPEAEFIAMGASMPEELAKRRDKGLVVRGYVEDLASELSTIRVMVAPLRVGAGAKGKVASALAHGVPCVVSPIAAEGMNVHDRQTVLLAHSPSEFAERIEELYRDADLWRSISQAGLRLMSGPHSLEANDIRIANILASIGAPVPNKTLLTAHPADATSVK
jgi:glycosyltransferase involved in cell wall biosynthesis